MSEKSKEQYIIDIVDLGNQGEGIGRLDGLAVFVADAIPGDRVLVEISQQKKNFAKADLLEILEPSKDRVNPPCIYAEECGGCSLQHMDYQAQLNVKEGWLRNALERIAGIENPEILGIVGMDEPWRYRNKAGYAVGRGLNREPGSGTDRKPGRSAGKAGPTGTGSVGRVGSTGKTGPAVGFYKKRSHQVVDCETCLLQVEQADIIVRCLRDFIDKNQWLAGITVKTALASREIMLVVEAEGKGFKLDTGKLGKELLRALENADVGAAIEPFEIKSLMLAKDNKIHQLADKPTIKDRLLGLDFEISANSFYQVNPVQTEKLYEKVREFAGLTDQETVLDLYCGIGTIGLILADKAKKVIGIESVKQSVLDANRNATINGIVNAEYIYGKAEEVLPELVGKGLVADLVILDPPRAGCHPELLSAVVDAKPTKIIYVSCDPATLARDIKILTQQGYKFEKAQAIDMFPHTGHVEAVTRLVRE